MFADIKITDNDIQFAERILLPSNHKFDKERIDFIKNLETIDLQAVPGSGKTTALMAKLLILERFLPFSDGSGILVLSHTNAAVDEIKSKLGPYCQQLFQYPNFVGTIQKFVNEFLTIPIYETKYKHKLLAIDNDFYFLQAQRFNYMNFSKYADVQNKAKLLLHVNDLFKRIRYSHIDGKFAVTNEYNGKEVVISKPNRNKNSKNYIDWNEIEKTRIKSWIICFRNKILSNGYLTYDDSYFFALHYLLKYPEIVLFLQKRFRYVFIDEMQDMDIHQYDLLERLFFSEKNQYPVFQRIGDRNQAIYDGKVKLNEIWFERENTLTINGSNRLSVVNAEIVDKFSLYRNEGFQVKGLREVGIKPKIILFNDTNITNVIHKYSEIIHNLIITKEIPINEKNTYKAIGWRKFTDQPDKISITSYHNDFVESTKRILNEDITFIDYLRIDNNICNSLSKISKNIIDAILKVLRLEDVQSQYGHFFTKKSLLDFLSNEKEQVYDELILSRYKWSIEIAKGNIPLSDIEKFCGQLLNVFDKNIDVSNNFIHDKSSNEERTKTVVKQPAHVNLVNYHGFDIEVCTIHSEKGKTNTATLYLETYYEKDGRGENAKSYESERLCNQFLGSYLDNQARPRIQQSTKMMYVGLSRPTHLLCIAIHEDRFEKYLNQIDQDKWEIIYLENPQ